ncbi:MAG: carbohydrate kinase [Phyllobacteriaceae bacterium]|nr:carbohydrate kinase [Phyllobacteriaceae bacterium]MBA90385.1 carbohydrate kinase [Phyllobacteriaceae bacterium]
MTSPVPALVAVGGAHVDRRGRLAVPFSPGASHPGAMRETVGGGAFNAARAASGRGVQAALLSARGGDAAGAAVAEAIVDAGIRDLSSTFLDRTTPSYTSLLDREGEQIAGLADMALYETAFDRLLRRRPLRDAVAAADAVLADANLPESALRRLAEIAGDHPLHAMAVSPAKALRWTPLLERIACLFCNRAEAAALTGLAASARGGELARGLAARGLVQAVITSGNGPLELLENGRVRLLRPLPVRPVDVTGAGDALTGATLAALMNGRNLHDAALEGLAAAALAVETDASAPDLTAAAFQTRLAEARRLNAP